jgi:Sec-independent protein translocase protein TatA
MGHMVEILIVAVVALAIFGPKALQEIARNTGKGVSQANAMKEKFMADMPIKELNSVAETVSRVPTNPAQAMQMMVKNTLLPEEKKPAKKTAEKVVESPTSKVVLPPIEEPKTEI